MYQIFFFQAEDGIRDHCVTGVQTCALPIWSQTIAPTPAGSRSGRRPRFVTTTWWPSRRSARTRWTLRSEERRVGKGCRSWGVMEHKMKEMSQILLCDINGFTFDIRRYQCIKFFFFKQKTAYEITV